MSLFINNHVQSSDVSSFNISENIERECYSVLHKLHQVDGFQLVQVVVQPDLNPILDTDNDVNWLMEIIGYGLSMPISPTGEQDSVRDCCTIYCDWFASALLPYNDNKEDNKYQQLSKLAPVPVRRDPNRYARKMLSHLYNIFLPRQPIGTSSNTGGGAHQSNLTAVSRQAVLCHRVLRTIESVAHNPTNLMDDETWYHLLSLLLTVNDKLLSAPTEADDIGTQLQDRILGVLFDLMLLSSSRSIPDASLWKTFHEMCLNWRHRPALVEHWKRITLQLTKRVVSLPAPLSTKVNDSRSGAGGSQFAGQILDQSLSTNQSSSPIETAIASMSYENLSQTWYRFLKLIGNPVELSDPSVISRTDEFYHAACAANNILDPRQHPCLNVLPQIFMNSMSSLKDFIESFIGASQYPSIMLRRASQQQQQAIDVNVPQQSAKLLPDRPKCNSLLHIFGDWLFSAALIGSELNQEVAPASSRESGAGLPFDVEPNNTIGGGGGSIMSVASSSTTTEQVADPPPLNYSPAFSRRQSHQSTTSSYTSTSTTNRRRQSVSRQHDTSSNLNSFTSEKITLDPPLTLDSFESGQAEAMSILCRIFSSKTSSEDISPAYLARFYLCLQHCLTFGIGQDPKQPNQSGPIKRQLLASVLMHSTTLLQKDLDGINLLIPSFIKAIEFVFDCSEKEVPIQPPPRQNSKAGSVRYGGGPSSANSPNGITNYDLRRACILTLMNLLAYPFHFRELVIRNCLDGTSPTTTFERLRPRLLKLLFVALQTETDGSNMQILFGGLALAIHDLPSASSVVPQKEVSDARGARKKNDSRKDAGDSSTHSSLDGIGGGGSNNTSQGDDNISQNSFVFNSSNGFLIKSLHVTCHLLINIWKHDNLVSLAALEVLTTIARISSSFEERESLSRPPTSNSGANSAPMTTNNNLIISANNNLIEMKSEYMQTTKWICDYICNQCSRPPPAHSRDMHSTIVAAYQCLSVWFYNHPYLLSETNCVNTLMEVIELGVSGQKSKSISINPTVGVATNTTISKGEKILKPSSMRVREAAESLLNICMVRTSQNSHPNQLDECSYDTTLDEYDLGEMFGGAQYKTSVRPIQDQSLRRLEAYKMFKYFSDEDAIIFGFLESPNNAGEPTTKDSVICLLRTPFGKHCWKMKFNYYSEKSREKIIANKTLGLIKRPFHKSTTPVVSESTRIFAFPKGHNKSLYFNNTAKFFPETIENLTPTNLDKLVSKLEDYCEDPKFRIDLEKMNKIFSQQILAEQKAISESCIRFKRADCEEPQQMTDLETARVIVTHLGLKNALSSLHSGNKLSQSFVDQLRWLDNQSVRTCDSVNVFYVRRNRITPMEIVESVRKRQNVSFEFFEWLLELGQPIVARDHQRWTGRTQCHGSLGKSGGLTSSSSSSYEEPFSNRPLRDECNPTGGASSAMTRNQMIASDHGGAIFDGDRMILYWSDMCQEVAFLAPHRLERVGSNIIICWLECPDDLSSVPCQILLSQLEEASPQNSEEATATSNLSSSSSPGAVSDETTAGAGNRWTTAAATAAAASTAATGKSKEYATYFISPMKNGLYRVNLVTSCGRQWLALPLVDGMTVSKGMLSSLIRESVLNLCRRRRLDADSYQPPHVKRRLKIQDICNTNKISARNEPSEFYYNLFRSKRTNL